MIRALWFILKVAIVIAIAVWFIEHPGDLRVDWLGYVVETTVFLGTVVLLAVIGVAVGLYKLLRAVLGAPGRWSRWRFATGSGSKPPRPAGPAKAARARSSPASPR